MILDGVFVVMTIVGFLWLILIDELIESPIVYMLDIIESILKCFPTCLAVFILSMCGIEDGNEGFIDEFDEEKGQLFKGYHL